MSGEKPETEDIAARPKSPLGETQPPLGDTPSGPIDPATPVSAAVEAAAAPSDKSAKVSALEGLAGMKSKPPGAPAATEAPKLPEPAGAGLPPGKAEAFGASKPSDDVGPNSAPAAKTGTGAPPSGSVKPAPTQAPDLPKGFGGNIFEPLGGPARAGDESGDEAAAPRQPLGTPDSRELPKKAAPTQPEGPATPPPSAPIAAEPPRRGGFVAPFFGGILAAGLGFGLAHYVPEGWPIGPGTDRIAALQAQIAEQETRIAALAAQSAAPSDDSLAPRLAELEAKAAAPADLGALQEELDALKAQLAERPTGGAPVDLAPLRAEIAADIAAVRAEIAEIPRSTPADLEALRAAAQSEREAIEARAEATRAEAETTARAAMIRGAVLRLQAALETGSSFDAALADLGSVGVALPAALTTHASGVPALSSLQSRFPAAARQALAASTRPAEGAGVGDRLAAFLSAQTGLRSLTPQEGGSPDAVLSRAEAAVMAGDLAKALSEIDALPAEGAAALAEWRAEAETRLAATAATQSLIADLDKP